MRVLIGQVYRTRTRCNLGLTKDRIQHLMHGYRKKWGNERKIWRKEFGLGGLRLTSMEAISAEIISRARIFKQKNDKLDWSRNYAVPVHERSGISSSSRQRRRARRVLSRGFFCFGLVLCFCSLVSRNWFSFLGQVSKVGLPFPYIIYVYEYVLYVYVYVYVCIRIRICICLMYMKHHQWHTFRKYHFLTLWP